MVLLALCGLLVLSSTAVLPAQQPTENDAPVITMNFDDFPLNAIVHLIADMTPQDPAMINLELLDGIRVTVHVKDANAFELLDKLLKENGLKVHRTTNTWEYSKI